MPDEKKEKEYQSPAVVGDSSDLDQEFCAPVVCVLAAAVAVIAGAAVGNVVGAVNAAAAWNGGVYANVVYTDNWVSGPNPCSK
jgi:hypothetical protein